MLLSFILYHGIICMAQEKMIITKENYYGIL